MSLDPLLVLCGGLSTRMGQNKALLPYQTQTLLARLAHFAHEQQQPLWLSAGAHTYTVAPVAQWVPDALPGREGPLSALLGALDLAAKQGVEALYVMACDTLITPVELVACLRESQDKLAWHSGLTALSTAEGRCMPLLSRWSTALLPVLQQYTVQEGQRRVMGFVRRLEAEQPPRVALLPMPAAWQALSNFNTAHDFERATQERIHYDKTHASR